MDGNTDIISLLLCRTVTVTLLLLKFFILAKLVSFYNLPDIFVHDCIEVISNIIYYSLLLSLINM